MEEQQVILTSEPSLQFNSLYSFFLNVALKAGSSDFWQFESLGPYMVEKKMECEQDRQGYTNHH